MPEEMETHKKEVLFSLSEDRKIIILEGGKILVGDVGQTVSDPMPPFQDGTRQGLSLCFLWCSSGDQGEHEEGPGVYLLGPWVCWTTPVPTRVSSSLDLWQFWPSQTTLGLDSSWVDADQFPPVIPVWGKGCAFLITPSLPTCFPLPMLPTSEHNSDSVLVCLVLHTNRMLWDDSSPCWLILLPVPLVTATHVSRTRQGLSIKKKRERQFFKKCMFKENLCKLHKGKLKKLLEKVAGTMPWLLLNVSLHNLPAQYYIVEPRLREIIKWHY